MLNSTTIVTFTNTNNYYVTYNLGTTWSNYTLLSPLLNLTRIGNTLYGIDTDNNIQRLYVTYPGSISIYDQNGLLTTFTQSQNNFKNIGY
jgi:hypothetical protein